MESVVIVTTQVDRSYLLALLIDDIEFWGVMPYPLDCDVWVLRNTSRGLQEAFDLGQRV